jgi:uncharacterized lipoprotein YajG
MQSNNFNQQRVSTCDSADEQWQQILALKTAQDEIVILHEQISSLQQLLFEQLQQQQAIEQELQCANQELELINVENQQLFEEKRVVFCLLCISHIFLTKRKVARKIT